ncbi:MAG: Sigma 54 modulation protein / S30EA ribosomal protein [Verrucomicrobia bacterium]|nr:MAG: Sigma 54 modulation protein / S30EA ribosomal protein [Verrucomicrobiota bacterium]
MNHMSTTMRLNLHHLNLHSLETIDAWVKKQLFALGQARRIDEANVSLVRHKNASPPYQVNVHLVTPGPDVFAESRDHTLQAALVKAIAQLRAQITSRTAKRLQRFKSNLKGRRSG